MLFFTSYCILSLRKPPYQYRVINVCRRDTIFLFDSSISTLPHIISNIRLTIIYIPYIDYFIVEAKSIVNNINSGENGINADVQNYVCNAENRTDYMTNIKFSQRYS